MKTFLVIGKGGSTGTVSSNPWKMYDVYKLFIWNNGINPHYSPVRTINEVQDELGLI